jgi:hypothetical protein
LAGTRDTDDDDDDDDDDDVSVECVSRLSALTDRVGAEHAVVLTLLSHEALCGRDRLKRERERKRKQKQKNRKFFFSFSLFPFRRC